MGSDGLLYDYVWFAIVGGMALIILVLVIVIAVLIRCSRKRMNAHAMKTTEMVSTHNMVSSISVHSFNTNENEGAGCISPQSIPSSPMRMPVDLYRDDENDKKSEELYVEQVDVISKGDD